MTTHIIPGYFTHASVWLGFKNRRKYFKRPDKTLKITGVSINDRAMAEAITTGVRLSSLKEYAQGETYLIIRINSLTDVQRTDILNTAVKQLKKGYDFNFDIESSDLINCTELIYLCFDFVNWQTHYYMGRYTLFPDDILNVALSNKQFGIVAVYHKGNIIEHPSKQYIQELLGN